MRNLYLLTNRTTQRLFASKMASCLSRWCNNAWNKVRNICRQLKERRQQGKYFNAVNFFFARFRKENNFFCLIGCFFNSCFSVNRPLHRFGGCLKARYKCFLCKLSTIHLLSLKAYVTKYTSSNETTPI